MSRLQPSKFVPGIDRSDKSFQFTADFLAAIFTWGGIGWVADRALGTAPLLMVIGFIVGNMTGIYLLYIRSRDDGSVPQDVGRPDAAATDTAAARTTGAPNPPSQTDSERP